MTGDEARQLKPGDKLRSTWHGSGSAGTGRVYELIGDHGLDIMWDHGYRGYFAYADAAFWSITEAIKT